MRIEGEGLEHHRGVADADRDVGDVPAVEQNHAGIRPFDAGDDAQQRGLARAAGAQDGEKFTRLDGELGAAQRLDGAEALS